MSIITWVEYGFFLVHRFNGLILAHRVFTQQISSWEYVYSKYKNCWYIYKIYFNLTSKISFKHLGFIISKTLRTDLFMFPDKVELSSILSLYPPGIYPVSYRETKQNSLQYYPCIPQLCILYPWDRQNKTVFITSIPYIHIFKQYLILYHVSRQNRAEQNYLQYYPCIYIKINLNVYPVSLYAIRTIKETVDVISINLI